MNAIVAVDNNYSIGNKGNLLFHIPDDMRRFKYLTTGKVVVYGKKTLYTFPNQSPLKNRTNIILSHDNSLWLEGAIIVHSIDELLKELSKYDADDIYVIGGASIYKQLLPYIDTCEVTKVDDKFEADAYFPNLARSKEWKLVHKSDVYEYKSLEYQYQTWQRR